MRSLSPSPRLAPYLRDFMIVEVDDEVTRLRFPEPGVNLGVRYSGSAALLRDGVVTRLPDTTMTAMLPEARRMTTSARGGVILARFRTGAAAPFFRMPMHELFGLTLALDEVMPREVVARLHDAVCTAASDRERIDAFEAALLAVRAPESTDDAVLAAVRVIDARHGNLSMRALASQLDLTQDTFEKRFRRVVGTSPKHHAMLTRLRHAIASFRPGMRFTDLALDAGYFDQSHFNRELSAVTGESPTRFFAAQGR